MTEIFASYGEFDTSGTAGGRWSLEDWSHAEVLRGGFHKWGHPKILAKPMKMDDLGVPPFKETSMCLLSCNIIPNPSSK